MVQRTLDAGVLPARWVTAMRRTGRTAKFRLRLQQRRIGYVLAVPRSQKIPTEGGIARADTLAALAPNAAWKRRSAGDKVKGPRLYDWAVASLPDTGTADHGFTRWLLIRRSITNPSELATTCATALPTPRRATDPGNRTRWAIEECFQTAKNEVGLDQYQVRRYDAWYRHITLGDGGARLPRYHRRERGKGDTEPERDGLIALTLGEVRRLLAHLITRTRPRDLIRRWSRWRRRHQYRARTEPLPAKTQTPARAAGVLATLKNQTKRLRARKPNSSSNSTSRPNPSSPPT